MKFSSPKYLILFTALVFAFSTGCRKSGGEAKGEKDDTYHVPTGKAVEFTWDFTRQRKFIYTYHQIALGSTWFNADQPPSNSSLTGDGLLTVRVKDDTYADVSLIDVEATMLVFDNEGEVEDTLINNLPATVVQDMKNDGSFEDPTNDILFDILLPLPRVNLEVGAGYELPLKVPFNAAGSRLWSKGRNTLTFTGYEKVDGHRCAVLEGIIDISDLEVPQEMTGEYLNKTTGRATYYFDIKNKYYVGADILLDMEVLMNTDSGIEDDLLSNYYMRILTENTFKIRLKEIQRQ